MPKPVRDNRRLALGAVVAIVSVCVCARIYSELAAPDAESARATYADRVLAWTNRSERQGSYAAVVAGPHSTMWAELLAASGVPLPIESVGATTRLVVHDDPSVAIDESPDRAVVEVVHGTPHAATELRWNDLVVPLVGVDVVALEVTGEERVLARDEQGAAIIVIRPSDRGVRIRTGVDLAALVSRLRFGVPANADRDVDANHEIQPADLAPTLAADVIARPFADELVAALLTAIDHALPCALPRTRGLPAGVDSLVVLTSDQDFADDTWVLEMATALADRDAHATFLLTDPAIGLPADLNRATGSAPTLGRASADALFALGHDVGVHPFPRTIADLAAHVGAFRARIGLAPLAARNHHLRWMGYLDVPRAEAELGIAMNLDTMPVCDGTRPCVGFPGGSSQPMMFVDEHGARIPILHQPTSLDDFSLRQPRYELLAGAARELERAAHRILDAGRRAGVPVVLNAHPSLFKFAPSWVTSLLDAPGVRAVSAGDWLEFVLARRSVRVPNARCGAPRPTLPAGVAWR